MDLISSNLYLTRGLKYLFREHFQNEYKEIRVFDLCCPVPTTSPPLRNEKIVYFTPTTYSLALKQLVLHYLPPGNFISMCEPVSKVEKQFAHTQITDVRIISRVYLTLTRTELKVIDGLIRTQSVRLCAKELSISEKGVSAHKVKALRKLGFTGIRELIYFYRIIESVCGIKMKLSGGG